MSAEKPQPDQPTMPQWVKEAQMNARIKRQDFLVTGTGFDKATHSADIFEQSVSKLPGELFAIIGLGFSNNGWKQSIVPQIVAARAQSLGINYRMLLIDNVWEITHAIKKQKVVYAPLQNEKYYSFSTAKEKQKKVEENRYNWNRFLSETGQKDRIVKTWEEDFHSGESSLLTEEIREGIIHAADVPMLFRSKLENGDIKVITADVASDSWIRPEKVSYIDCFAVLMHLPLYDARLAMWNMAKALQTGGILFVDNNNEVFRHYKEDDGWLDDSKMNDLGLTDISGEYTRLKNDTILQKQ